MRMRAVRGWMLKPDLPVPRNDLERLCEILYTLVWQADEKKIRRSAERGAAARAMQRATQEKEGPSAGSVN